MKIKADGIYSEKLSLVEMALGEQQKETLWDRVSGQIEAKMRELQASDEEVNLVLDAFGDMWSSAEGMEANSETKGGYGTIHDTYEQDWDSKDYKWGLSVSLTVEGSFTYGGGTYDEAPWSSGDQEITGGVVCLYRNEGEEEYKFEF